MTEKEQDRGQSQDRRAARDLGTIGGGLVPNAGAIPENRTAEVVKGQEQPMHKNANTVDSLGQSNLGGRNPGQAQNSMGDQDRTRSRPGDDPTDPMTSRDPDKIKQQKEQEK